MNPVGADPYFYIEPSALVAAAVPVPEVVPPALSTVSEIELSTVPVTVNVPEEPAPAGIAMALMQSTVMTTAASASLCNFKWVS